MIRILFALFIVLHGLVHVLYFGQSQKYFQLQAGLTWPDGSWAFSRLMGDGTTRSLTGILCVLAAVTLVAGGIGLLAQWGVWRSIIIGGVAFSTMIYLLLWNGKAQALDAQGLVGILINLAILALLLLFRWPKLDS
jgi:hypothetical protein